MGSILCGPQLVNYQYISLKLAKNFSTKMDTVRTEPRKNSRIEHVVQRAESTQMCHPTSIGNPIVISYTGKTTSLYWIGALVSITRITTLIPHF